MSKMKHEKRKRKRRRENQENDADVNEYRDGADAKSADDGSYEVSHDIPSHKVKHQISTDYKTRTKTLLESWGLKYGFGHFALGHGRKLTNGLVTAGFIANA